MTDNSFFDESQMTCPYGRSPTDDLSLWAIGHLLRTGDIGKESLLPWKNKVRSLAAARNKSL